MVTNRGWWQSVYFPIYVEAFWVSRVNNITYIVRADRIIVGVDGVDGVDSVVALRVD